MQSMPIYFGSVLIVTTDHFFNFTDICLKNFLMYFGHLNKICCLSTTNIGKFNI